MMNVRDANSPLSASRACPQRRLNPNYDGRVPDPEILDLARNALLKWPLHESVSSAKYDPGTRRYALAASELAKYLTGSMLDVGSRNDTLERITGKTCALVDKNNPALPAFDWEREDLPYADSSFDTVVCLDTLEHLSRPHEALDDLLRISRHNVIVSLPNCWQKSVKELLSANGREPSYGLPLERPKDRHHWFFNSDDALMFLAYRALSSSRGYDVADIRLHAPARHWWQGVVYPLLIRLCPRYFANLIVRTVFIVLVRR